MRKKLPKILVTGGAGFIGSAFVRSAVKKGYKICICDKLTYAGDLERLKEVKDRYTFYKVDICNRKKMMQILRKEKPRIIAHFAAETHVDRSIQDVTPFIETNVKGTQVLLDISRKYNIQKFIHLSTDEIYGEIRKGKFTEDSPLKPNSPYAASKAAADLLIRSYIRSYAFPAIIIRPCNNYGPWQYPEKLIPLAISRIIENRKVPLYAEGKNIREWLYVEDCAEGILEILKRGKVGKIYNLGSNEEKINLDVVDLLLGYFNKPKSIVEFVKDRPGHDFRYSLDSHQIYKQIKWKPKVSFEDGIRITVSWYLKNKNWLLNKLKRKI